MSDLRSDGPLGAGAASTMWEVRTPLRYGSKHHKWYATEAHARAAAEARLDVGGFGDVGLQIHTKTRTIYINHDDDN